MVHDGFLLLVGTFRSPEVYTLLFKPASRPGKDDASLTVAKKSPAVGGHSWLALSADKTRLYTTCWTDPPSVASYRIRDDASVELLNQKPVRALSGYVAVTDRYLYSAGGPTGEVFSLAADGSIGDLAQEVSFRKSEELEDGKRDGVAHGSFGGLRHGSHSVDLSPDGKSLYVADIGHNCIWTYSVDESRAASKTNSNSEKMTTTTPGPLTLGTKHISPRSHDGPRHTWPHPSGRVLYCVQEHSSMVDAFRVAADGVTLEHMHGFTILPDTQSCEDFWADEVRLSNLNSTAEDSTPPRYLYASTRGLEASTKGYVAAYELRPDGSIAGPAVDIFETRTSGGLANAIEPAPGPLVSDGGDEFIALTDSEQGLVVILAFDGSRFREVASTRLVRDGGEVAAAATAVWL